MFTMMSPIGRLDPSRNTVPKISTGCLSKAATCAQTTGAQTSKPSNSQGRPPCFVQRSIVLLRARGVPAKDLPGHCAGDLRPFVRLVSLCLPQLPLPEKIPMLKRSHHDGTQISVG